jgi:CRISPR-associated Csx2 family protein
MRNIYLSFLGLGKKQPDGSYAYDRTVYELNSQRSQMTAFVQVAELEIIGAELFDEVIIVDTEKSHHANYAVLKKQLRDLGAKSIHAVTIEEEMSPQGQWRWFEKILCCIESEDRLTVDLTHGYRAAPIIFSAAINFLQKARNVRLEAVYYGVFEKVSDLGHAPIIDMKEFYAINEWAEAVSRLVEDADAQKLALVAENSPGFQFSEINNGKILHVLRQLTDTIKNVDVNNVAGAAGTAIGLIRQKEESASKPVKMLLGLVIDKFVALTTQTPQGGKYDKAYFRIQLELIRLLLDHHLFMQAYTVMREFIASLCMIGFEKEGMSNKKRKKRRRIHAEVFVNMVQHDEDEWSFPGKKDILERIKPFYQELKKHGIERQIRTIARDLADYRNGFDHAWICKAGAKEDIEEKGFHFLKNLKKILFDLEEKGLLL